MANKRCCAGAVFLEKKSHVTWFDILLIHFMQWHSYICVPKPFLGPLHIYIQSSVIKVFDLTACLECFQIQEHLRFFKWIKTQDNFFFQWLVTKQQAVSGKVLQSWLNMGKRVTWPNGHIARSYDYTGYKHALFTLLTLANALGFLRMEHFCSIY